MKKIVCIMLFCLCISAWGQTDRREVRSGNRKYRKGDYKEAEIDFRRALVKDSLSLAGNYNLGADLYRQERYDEAGKSLETIAESVRGTASEADYWYNLGASQLQMKDYSAAKKSFRESLLLNPDDMDAKENYSYAKKMEKEQQDQQQQHDQNQNQDQQNQDQNQDQNQNKDQNKDQNQDQQQDQDKDQQQNQPQPQEISPQQAQQMLKAVQAKEKETQDKVNKEKAALLQSRQKDKNW
ncbi:MAG: tetratricopeptide repeat protein [Bacteroidales bacterium]|nr:tetratricopeptide repeat protein [Bacteroidales bacterium]